MFDATDAPQVSIALVGLMGAGKTTLGRELAARLALPFVDADAEIEAEAGLAVAAIFARHGEAHFRDQERRIVARLVEGPAKVIATGGGAFVDPGTRALLLARCTVVWLDADVATLAERAARDGGRPLLGALAALAEARNPVYAEAHFRVPSDEAAVARIAELVR